MAKKKLFIVERKETWTQLVGIMAESAEQAIEILEEGDDTGVDLDCPGGLEYSDTEGFENAVAAEDFEYPAIVEYAIELLKD